jgi:hypothetical protein
VRGRLRRRGWLAVGKFLRDVFAGAEGNMLSDQAQEAGEEDDSGATITFDPSNGAAIVDSGTTWGEDDNGNFQAGWYWTDSNGMTYYDMNMDGSVDSRGYFSSDGTYWTDNMDNNWTTPSGPPN